MVEGERFVGFDSDGSEQLLFWGLDQEPALPAEFSR